MTYTYIMIVSFKYQVVNLKIIFVQNNSTFVCVRVCRYVPVCPSVSPCVYVCVPVCLSVSVGV